MKTRTLSLFKRIFIDIVDIPLPMKTRNELVKSGRVLPPPVLPQSGWVDYCINK
jgi:hypothetical protein